MTITEMPQISVSLTGDAFKIFHVTGAEGMFIPRHYSSKEAVISVQKGSAVLQMGKEEYMLKADQSFIIPAGEKHSLQLKEDFQAVVIMGLDSEIRFVSI